MKGCKALKNRAGKSLYTYEWLLWMKDNNNEIPARLIKDGCLLPFAMACDIIFPNFYTNGIKLAKVWHVLPWQGSQEVRSGIKQCRMWVKNQALPTGDDQAFADDAVALLHPRRNGC